MELGRARELCHSEDEAGGVAGDEAVVQGVWVEEAASGGGEGGGGGEGVGVGAVEPDDCFIEGDGDIHDVGLHEGDGGHAH